MPSSAHPDRPASGTPQYRARQTRISATRSQDLAERTRLLREAEAALRRCLELDPTDGRPYVSLGKILVLQRRYEEAGKLYEAGAAATGAACQHACLLRAGLVVVGWLGG